MLIIKKPKDPTPATQANKTVEIDAFSMPGEVNRYGVKIIPMSSGFEQWIIDAKTGKPARRENYDCMEANGFYLWIKKGEKLGNLDIPYPSVWNK